MSRRRRRKERQLYPDGEKHWPDGDALCRHVRELSGDTVILAFSAGKDSIAAWLQLRQHFPRIVPYYRYMVPGLRFIEETLAYYEDWFGTRIIRYPDPTLLRMLHANVFQPPRLAKEWDKRALSRDLSSDHIAADVRAQTDTEGAFIGIGWRKSDSFRRRQVLDKYGTINYAQQHFHPIFDWTEKRIATELQAVGLKLPVDYRLFNRSFEGVRYRFLEPIRRYYPDDWERILEWFPLAEAEFARRRFYEQGRSTCQDPSEGPSGRSDEAPAPSVALRDL